MRTFNLVVAVLLAGMLAAIAFLSFGETNGECWRRNGLCRHLVAASLRVVVGFGATTVHKFYIVVLMATQLFSETREEALAACTAFLIGGALSYLYTKKQIPVTKTKEE
eukprot:TRINITY_DN4274_c1_g1_i1.p1 TRINITY_DN4274_c1_g1~~TRINITY_DN4274_c1_g1_i1.p1  ORF type:complete len:109 (+),score=20.09 TRINITY_DN4274_c1_g1_i1:68-394(+)